MKLNQTDELCTQIRTAHRLLAGYYQRLLPSIEQAAKELGLDFYFWLPREFNRPGRLTSNPFEAWQWDMLPGLSTYYTFKKVEDVNKLRVGEYLVSFWVISDSGVSSEAMKGVQADALSLPTSVQDADSIIKIGIYTPYKNVDQNWFHKVWYPCPHPEYVGLDQSPIVSEDKQGYPIVSCGFQVPISRIMTNEGIEEIVAKTGLLRDEALNLASKLSQEHDITNTETNLS
ncbi:hypothetical protein [uncultured Photobacterium sp.]|uniref:hypothetical protein n=1 Tax=uncultured Photobacterium sp. TaxID=173973 RepID=UPI00262837B0|nr:hypothetical protein [uncultured Photobacterium sp.]